MTNFAEATKHRPFAARYQPNPHGRSGANAVTHPVQVGVIGRTYRLTTTEATELAARLRAAVTAGVDRVPVVIDGCPYTRPGASSGNRRAATTAEAAALIEDLDRAVSAAGTTEQPEG